MAVRDAEAMSLGLEQSALGHLLGYQITQANVVARRVFHRHIGTPFKLTPVEFTILVLLANNCDVTPKQLAQALSVSAPNVTTLLDRLAQRELLTRARSETDRRAQNLRLTRKGTALARQVHQLSLSMERNMIRRLSEAERGMLMELLRKLADQRID